MVCGEYHENSVQPGFWRLLSCMGGIPEDRSARGVPEGFLTSGRRPNKSRPGGSGGRSPPEREQKKRARHRAATLGARFRTEPQDTRSSGARILPIGSGEHKPS